MADRPKQRKAAPGRKASRKTVRTSQESQKAEQSGKLAEKLSLAKRKDACEQLGKEQFPEQCAEPLSEAAAPIVNSRAKKKRFNDKPSATSRRTKKRPT